MRDIESNNVGSFHSFTLSISTLPEERYVKITIEDQCIGISEKHISNIFDPYFATKQKGNDLGLATTYSII